MSHPLCQTLGPTFLGDKARNFSHGEWMDVVFLSVILTPWIFRHLASRDCGHYRFKQFQDANVKKHEVGDWWADSTPSIDQAQYWKFKRRNSRALQQLGALRREPWMIDRLAQKCDIHDQRPHWWLYKFLSCRKWEIYSESNNTAFSTKRFNHASMLLKK